MGTGMGMNFFYGDGDGDEYFLRGWVWDNETRPRPVAIPNRVTWQ